ncbi:MAG: glutamine synthetase family protein [Acidimicrobiales bacterium]
MEEMSLEHLASLAASGAIHTVEVAAPDTQGHLRGKRVPIARFLATVASSGVNIADAMFVFDIENDLPENEFVNMDSGYLDCKLMPDLVTTRVFTHRPGYAIVFSEAVDHTGARHPLAPRGVLATQIERCDALGIDPFVATELEFYLCTPDWEPAMSDIQYSSLTQRLDLEDVLHDMRNAVAGAGIEVESSNLEYGPGQVEINTGPADAMTMADSTVLFKSIVKQVAYAHGLRATFMPKPWADQSGSGMHIHTSLKANGGNAFADSQHLPNELMSQWLAGQLEHASALAVLGASTVNGPRRVRPYTFCPTHIHWGLDNRTVMARCIVEPGSAANRVEYRSAGADANPYLMIAGLLAAGCDGIERKLELGPASSGDMYTDPGDCTPLPTDLSASLAAFQGSALAGQLGDTFARSFASIVTHEIALGSEHGGDGDDINDWERARYLEHS